ncbi:MAG: Rab family GTPase [Candidatus Hodarchaeales archaeon]|jgi:small GTP-binding protein
MISAGQWSQFQDLKKHENQIVESPLKFKICLLGNRGAGKTSLSASVRNDAFSRHQRTTVGFDVQFKTIDLAGLNIALLVWDVGGNDLFASFAHDAEGAIIIFSADDPRSFRDIPFWISRFEHYNQRAPFIIVGNKIDIARRAISKQDGERLATLYKAPYIETSAKTGTNVEEAFRIMTILVLGHVLEKELSEHGISLQQQQKSSQQPCEQENLQNVLAYVQQQRYGLKEQEAAD